MPDYRGSDETRGYLLPFPYLIYRGEVLKVDRQQIRGLLFQTDRLQLDLSFHGSVPVDSSKNKARQGMPDLDPTVEIGPSLQYLLTENKTAGYKITLTFPLRAVVATDLRNFNAAGWTFSPRLNLNRFNLFQKGWILGLSLGPIFGDQVYHDYYFRVDKAFSTPDRPAYSAAGGYGGTQCTLSLGKHFKKIWMGLFVRGEDLHNTAFSDSPLLKSRTSLMGGLALSWIFWESKTLAAADK
jgi:outer membrane scaffolding protein for murein synthesis (MipA/OmpV family)